VSHLVKTRHNQPVKTTGDLAKIASDHVLPAKRNKFLAQVFQALRIELNQEMQALEEMLMQMANVIRPGGKLVVLSYHSLEDRMVKNLIRPLSSFSPYWHLFLLQTDIMQKKFLSKPKKHEKKFASCDQKKLLCSLC
jgi:16S rRNA C1402 N4-methylase RsmH